MTFYLPHKTGTISLVTDLCSVSETDLRNDMYNNQIHRHTFTCTKKGETSCRFRIPYWPMRTSRVLLPMAKDDGRFNEFREKHKILRQNLENRIYISIDQFLADNHLTEENYLNIIRSSLTRPTLIFKREMAEIMTNTFHPWIASTLNSNMNLQFILDEYSCVSYVVDYINKADRGTGDLYRELIELSESHPEMTHERLLRQLGSKVLNTVEMSAQEGAWTLLRQPMSHASREVTYIPTCWSYERQKSYKTKAQLDQSNVDLDSTDVWTKNVIQKYEERSSDLRDICLADFVAWYNQKKSTSQNVHGDHDSEEENDQNDQNAASVSTVARYTKRKQSRIIRYRN